MLSLVKLFVLVMSPTIVSAQKITIENKTNLNFSMVGIVEEYESITIYKALTNLEPLANKSSVSLNWVNSEKIKTNKPKGYFIILDKDYTLFPVQYYPNSFIGAVNVGLKPVIINYNPDSKAEEFIYLIKINPHPQSSLAVESHNGVYINQMIFTNPNNYNFSYQ